MELIRLRITGISPLLMNNPESMGGGPSKGLGTKKIPTPEEESAAKVYRNGDGQLYFPADGLRNGIIKKACPGRRIGKRYASAIVPGALFLTQEKLLLIHPKTHKPITKYEIDIRRCVVQGQGVRRARPKIMKWGGIVTYEFDPDFLPGDTVVELQSIAGKLAGLGDYRPQCGGPFGRYTVELIE